MCSVQLIRVFSDKQHEEHKIQGKRQFIFVNLGAAVALTVFHVPCCVNDACDEET